MSKPFNPASAVAGTSGICGRRVKPATAKAFNVAAFMCGIAMGGLTDVPMILPLKTAVTGSPPLS
jgi:hypothetical protein